MFISKSRLAEIVAEIDAELKYLRKRIDDERKERWRLSEEFTLLVDHLGLKAVDIPKAIKYLKKDRA